MSDEPAIERLKAWLTAANEHNGSSGEVFGSILSAITNLEAERDGLEAQAERFRNLNETYSLNYAEAKARAQVAKDKLAGCVEALERIGERARHDGLGQRTFDDVIRDIGWIDDECRAALTNLQGEDGN
jgi:hypothetical protein